MDYLNNLLKLMIFLEIASVEASLTIETSYGTIQGAWNQTKTGRTYASFRGIPYAKPPVDERRFMDPEPLEPWSDTLNATEYPTACRQFSIFSQQFIGIEDCLYLNIFRSNSTSQNLLPVIVVIPGGGLLSGSSDEYDPERIMNHDVVLVSMNYRLGPFAYLQDGLLEDLEARWDNLTSEIFCYEDSISSTLYKETAEKIKQYYLDGKSVSPETFYQLTKALGDRNFVSDVGKLAELHASISEQPVYMGIYSYRGNYSFSDLLSNSTKNLGCSHLDDFIHIFKLFNLDSNTTGDLTMNENLVQIIVSFATNGVPTLPDGTEWIPITANSSVFNIFEIISPTQFEYTNISTTEFGNRSFWDSLGFEENENVICV